MANTMDEKFSRLEQTLRNLTILVKQQQQQALRHNNSRSSSHKGRSTTSASQRSNSGSDGEFKTDERGYKGKVAQSFLIEVEDPPEEEEDEESNPHVPFDMPVANNGVEAEDLPEVSLYALVGSARPQTMRVTMMLKGKVTSLLIDNGSTHNFISTKVSHKLQIPTTIIEPFDVQVASREHLACTQQCKAVSLKIQHIYVAVDLYVIPLAEIDIVLVVQEPTNLPPSRPFDHYIPLLDEQPINVAPYRYAHHQKVEIEKQVKEMLQKNLIRPSTNPFSSPVLLVKKKDGTWRFYTDY
ncbi:uncharacterized protein LOC127794801 [Diospyros lotus]|uniref:uncharacterized protein LOC127794801 n=1 Tax=Diospyros lotus TaxID=55363 RepID=UPI00225B523B|nr:uncharacterized protein LOC127794801 [Diospyros lotus]